MKPTVFFMGTVGVGKSTQTILLCRKLRDLGLKANITHIRYNHLLAYSLTWLLARLVCGSLKSEPISSIHNYNRRLFNRLYRLWLPLLFMSLAMKYLLTVYIPNKLGYTVLVEDGPITTICDHLHILRAFEIEHIGTFATSYFLKILKINPNAYAVILDAQTKTLISRWKMRRSFSIDKGYLEDPLDYLGFQGRIPLKLMKIAKLKHLTVETDRQTPNQVADVILEWLLRHQESQHHGNSNATCSCADATKGLA